MDPITLGLIGGAAYLWNKGSKKKEQQRIMAVALKNIENNSLKEMKSNIELALEKLGFDSYWLYEYKDMPFKVKINPNKPEVAEVYFIKSDENYIYNRAVSWNIDKLAKDLSKNINYYKFLPNEQEILIRKYYDQEQYSDVDHGITMEQLIEKTHHMIFNYYRPEDYILSPKRAEGLVNHWGNYNFKKTQNVFNEYKIIDKSDFETLCRNKKYKITKETVKNINNFIKDKKKVLKHIKW